MMRTILTQTLPVFTEIRLEKADVKTVSTAGNAAGLREILRIVETATRSLIRDISTHPANSEC